MESIKRILMRRDGCSAAEADELVGEAIAETRLFLDGDSNSLDPEQILYEDFGLEPDYIFELMEV